MVGLRARAKQCLPSSASPSSTFPAAAASLCSRNVSYTARLNLRGSGGSLLALLTRPPKPVGDRDEPEQAGAVGWRLSQPRVASDPSESPGLSGSALLPTETWQCRAEGTEVPWDVSPARSRGLAPTRNSSWHQDPVAQSPGSMAAPPQGVFSGRHVCTPTLCHHKEVRGPVLGVLWEGTALLVGL